MQSLVTIPSTQLATILLGLPEVVNNIRAFNIFF